eukprot:g3822.t1
MLTSEQKKKVELTLKFKLSRTQREEESPTLADLATQLKLSTADELLTIIRNHFADRFEVFATDADGRKEQRVRALRESPLLVPAQPNIAELLQKNSSGGGPSSPESRPNKNMSLREKLEELCRFQRKRAEQEQQQQHCQPGAEAVSGGAVASSSRSGLPQASRFPTQPSRPLRRNLTLNTRDHDLDPAILEGPGGGGDCEIVPKEQGKVKKWMHLEPELRLLMYAAHVSTVTAEDLTPSFSTSVSSLPTSAVTPTGPQASSTGRSTTTADLGQQLGQCGGLCCSVVVLPRRGFGRTRFRNSRERSESCAR